ncbi:MAG: hypothetical protein ACPL4I_10780 [Bacteroidota bacterium]
MSVFVCLMIEYPIGLGFTGTWALVGVLLGLLFGSVTALVERGVPAVKLGGYMMAVFIASGLLALFAVYGPVGGDLAHYLLGASIAGVGLAPAYVISYITVSVLLAVEEAARLAVKLLSEKR